MNDFFRSTPNEADTGAFDRETFLCGMEAVRNQPFPPAPTQLLVSPDTQNEGRHQAIGAARTARWLWCVADELPWWAWRRRSWLVAAGIERARFAESLWQLFGTGNDG